MSDRLFIYKDDDGIFSVTDMYIAQEGYLVVDTSKSEIVHINKKTDRVANAKSVEFVFEQIMAFNGQFGKGKNLILTNKQILECKL
jgi:hypothetical protein